MEDCSLSLFSLCFLQMPNVPVKKKICNTWLLHKTRYTNKPPHRICKRVYGDCVCGCIYIMMADGKGKHQVRPIKDDVYQVMLHGKQQNFSANRSACRLLKKYKVEDRRCPVTGQVSKKVVSNFIFIINYENLGGGDFGENFKVACGFTPIVSAGLEVPNDGEVLVYFRLSNCLSAQAALARL